MWRLRSSGPLRIGFFVQGLGPHWDIAKHLIASARKVMPDVEIVQLTDENTPAHDVAVERIPGDMPMGVRRVQHYCREGDWCFVDTDVVFQKDVRSVFEDEFAVALVSRDGTYMEGTPYARAMPYNFGVVFSRGPEFWKRTLHYLKRLPPQLQEWEGEQLVTCELASRGEFKVKVLPSTYNFTPAKETDDLTEKLIVHYKGKRKAWMPRLDR